MSRVDLINECSQLDEGLELTSHLISSSLIESRCRFLQTLPNSLLVDLLSNWMTVWDIIWLDTAFCNHLLRPQFLQLLTEQGLVLNHLVSIPSKMAGYQMIQWIEKRQIHLLSLEGDSSLVLSFCKSMDRIRLNSLTSLSLELESFQFSNGSMIFDSLPSLAHLTLLNVIGDSVIIQMLKHCSNLKSLKIQNTSVFPMSSLYDLPSYCSKLKSLSFSQLNFDLVLFFVVELSDLEEIIIETCHSDLNAAARQDLLLEKLSDLPTSKLSSIKRISCKFAWHSGGMYFPPTFNLCSRLESLYLSGYYINDNDIKHLTNCCPLLQHFHITDSVTLTNEMLFHIMFCYHGQLTSLNVAYCSLLTDELFFLVIDALSESLESFTFASSYYPVPLKDGFSTFLKQCKRLKSLSLTCVAFGEEVWSRSLIEEGFASSLTSLTLCRCDRTSNEEFVSILQKYGKTLRNLEISEVPSLSDSVLLAIAENCSLLRELNISGAKGLSEVGMKSCLGERMPYLRTLIVQRVDVTSEVVRWIGRGLRMLEVLDLSHCPKCKYEFESLEEVSQGCMGLHTLVITGLDNVGSRSLMLRKWFPPYRVNVVT